MRLIERHGLWVILALALLLRLSPILFEHQVGQDIAEYKNIAENLRAGRGFLSDIKAYYAAPVRPADVTGRIGGFMLGPVEHYAFTDRPLLLPALIALLRLVLPPLAAGQVVGPLLYLLALALIYQTVRREVGPAAAFSAGLLLALNPALFDLSLRPFSENTVLFALALIAWAHFRMRSPLLTGMACSLAFLARPSTLMFAAILGLIYLIQSIRRREPMRVVQFAFCAAVGPVWVMALNRAMGMPPLTLPQSFLFRVRSFEDGLNTFHTGAFYGSALELIRSHGREAARRVALNGLYYAKALVTSEDLGMLVALAPIAMAGLSQASSRPLRRLRLLALFAALDLGLYVATWSTFDSGRFLGVTLFVGILLVALGSHEVLDREPLFRFRWAWRSAASWAALAVGLVWLVMDGGHAWLAWREWRLDKPLSNNLEEAWSAPGVKELLAQMNKARGETRDPAKLPVVASNDPWLINARTGMRAARLPLDLTGAEWLTFLDGVKADLVVIQQNEWPEAYRKQFEELETRLLQAGWRPWYEEGAMNAWRRPLKKE